MFVRLTVMLCGGLYASMAILGTDQSGYATHSVSALEPAVPESARSAAAPAIAPLAATASFAGSPEAVVVPAMFVEQVTPTAAAYSPAAPETETAGEDDGLLRIGTLDAPVDVLTERGIDVVEVTGSVVNLRAGPSTDNNVVAKLRQGSRAELIEVASNGWMQIRDLDSGTEGYMSADFLQRVTPG